MAIATGGTASSAAAGGWDAARDSLLPLAENAAGAAGKYLAEHAPDVVRDRVVPRFIDAFNVTTAIIAFAIFRAAGPSG